MTPVRLRDIVGSRTRWFQLLGQAMYYDLDTLQDLCAELGFSYSRLSPDELDVLIEPAVPLVFQNLRNEEDTILGFRGTSWHSHGTVILNRRDATCIDLDELDIVQNLKDGNVVIVEMYVAAELRDRWLAHREEKPDLQYMTPGEEIRIRRLP